MNVLQHYVWRVLNNHHCNEEENHDVIKQEREASANHQIFVLSQKLDCVLFKLALFNVDVIWVKDLVVVEVKSSADRNNPVAGIENHYTWKNIANLQTGGVDHELCGKILSFDHVINEYEKSCSLISDEQGGEKYEAYIPAGWAFELVA